MGLLYRRAGRLTTKNGGFRPGQDGAPFFAANHSYRRARQLSDAMPAAEQQRVVPYADMTRTRLSGHLNELAKSSIPEGAYPHTIAIHTASQHQNEIVGNFSLGFVHT